MNSEKGRALHAQAEKARELEQDFLKSLRLLDEAVVQYLADDDVRGASEALQSRSSAFKHLYQHTSNSVYLTLALESAKTGLTLAKAVADTSGLTMAYRGVGKIYEHLENWKEASVYFQKAHDAFVYNPPPGNDRPAVFSDLKAHLGFVLYMSGEKENGLTYLNEAIQQLTGDTEEQKYNRDVWLSGAHMRAAAMLKDNEPQEAKNHLTKAKEIIEGNKELVLRKKQLEKLQVIF